MTRRNAHNNPMTTRAPRKRKRRERRKRNVRENPKTRTTTSPTTPSKLHSIILKISSWNGSSSCEGTKDTTAITAVSNNALYNSGLTKGSESVLIPLLHDKPTTAIGKTIRGLLLLELGRTQPFATIEKLTSYVQ
mmetsp:Transcript_284/g.630  ORF Transcript_284/g.630 Transcript_284/m.630 type:complete len:135 (-) Transcript_284:27-431(-)